MSVGQETAGAAAQMLGGVVWTVGVIMAGYLLGRRIPGIDTYLLPIIALSLIPVGLEVRTARRTRQASATITTTMAERTSPTVLGSDR